MRYDKKMIKNIKNLNKTDRILILLLSIILITPVMLSVVNYIKNIENEVSCIGKVNATMTYGRIQLELLNGNNKYSEFIAEPEELDENKQSSITRDIKIGDILRVDGKLTIVDNQPWIIIQSIVKITEKN